MKSLQDNYNLIKEGKGSKELFLKQVRREFPQYISNVNTFNQVTANLKTRGIISETLSSDITSKNTEPNWFNIFKENINEAKATEKKVTKEVKDLEEKNFDYKDTANADNLIGAEILTGFYAEMKDPKNLEKTVEEVRAIVIKNLSKDALYYVKDGQFGVKGLGYTKAEQKEAKGKYKASGYGDITEGTIKDSPMNDSRTEQIIQMLKDMDVDGETMEHILRQVGMDDQMANQLVNNPAEYEDEVSRAVGESRELRGMAEQELHADSNENQVKVTTTKWTLKKGTQLEKLTVGGKTYEIGDFDPNDDGRIESIEKYSNGYAITGEIDSDYGDGDDPEEAYTYGLDLDGEKMDEEDLEGRWVGN
jgi:hypothetical protein